MKHQKNERNERENQGRSQGRFESNIQGRQSREDDSSNRWQDRDEDRGYQRQGSRNDNYDYDTSRYGSRSRNTESGYDLESQRDSGPQGRSEDQNLGSQRYGTQSYGRQGSQQGYGGSELQNYGSQGSYGSRQDVGADRGRRSEISGRFFGRGPKNYKRSDDRIKEEIAEILTRDSEVDASEIEIEVKDGEVTLTGTVIERKMKYHAEDLVENCMGVKDIINNLRVRKEEGHGESKESLAESESERSEKRGVSGLSTSLSGSAGPASTSKKSSGTSAPNPSH